jgi:hypothetical protein
MIINYITKPYAVLSHGLKYITLFAWDFEGLGILSSHWTKRSHFMNIWGSERRETWPYAVLSHGLNYITLFAWDFEGLGILSSHLTKGLISWISGTQRDEITWPYAVLSHGLKYITLFAWYFEGLGILSSHWTKRSYFMNIWDSERRDTWRLENPNNGKLHDLYASHNIIRERKWSNNLMARDACGREEKRM